MPEMTPATKRAAWMSQKMQRVRMRPARLRERKLLPQLSKPQVNLFQPSVLAVQTANDADEGNHVHTSRNFWVSLPAFLPCELCPSSGRSQELIMVYAEAPLVSDGIDAAMAELDMDCYDDEDNEAQGVRGVFGNTNPGMAYYGANEEDPYIKLAAVEDADSEAEDFQISSNDYILLAARNEDDVSHLEVDQTLQFTTSRSSWKLSFQ